MTLIRLIQSIKSDFKNTFSIINQIIRYDHSKMNIDFAIVTTNCMPIKLNHKKLSLESIFDNFLWSAPKQRRSIEKRMRRKFGYWNKYVPDLKMLKKKSDLVICEECGSWHEMMNICQVCYLKVKKETTLIQNAIMKKLGLTPVEKEVKLRYEGEKDNVEEDTYFIEIPKERPEWFASNLISNTVTHDRKTKNVSENDNLEVQIVDK